MGNIEMTIDKMELVRIFLLWLKSLSLCELYLYTNTQEDLNTQAKS